MKYIVTVNQKPYYYPGKLVGTPTKVPSAGMLSANAPNGHPGGPAAASANSGMTMGLGWRDDGCSAKNDWMRCADSIWVASNLAGEFSVCPSQLAGGGTAR